MLSGVSGNLLVVDDAPSILIILKSFLESDRCRLFAAENGAKALQILQEEDIDLVLLDVMMPEMGGFEVCREMRANERTRDIPVIFLTGLGRKEEVIRGLEAGGSDYLVKPFDKEELILRVRHHLAATANQRRLKRLTREHQILNEALNDEVRRQEVGWDQVRSQLDGLDQVPPQLQDRLTNFDEFFQNMRWWSDLIAEEDSSMRSALHVREELAWDCWQTTAQQREVSLNLSGDDLEIFADIRMVNLMMGLLMPWIIGLASEESAISVQTQPTEEAVILEIAWKSTSDMLDAVPELHDLDSAPANRRNGEELPLRVALLVLKRHYGEVALTRDAPDSARLSLTFPNT